MEIKRYPDGTAYVTVNKNEPSKIVYRINSYDDLWVLGQVVDAFQSIGKRPFITIPNLIDAQADRRFGEGQSSGLKLVCKFLNSLPADFEIFHPHNQEVVEALMDNVRFLSNSWFVSKVLSSIKELYYKDVDELWFQNYLEDNVVLMSSDAGGFKPLVKLAEEIKWQGQIYSASKGRQYDPSSYSTKLTQIIDKQDFGGKDILLIDDICVYGGTFKGLSKMLAERNIGKVFLAVSHMTIQDLGTDPVTNYFDQVFTMNSKFDKYHYVENHTAVEPDNLIIFNV